MPKTGRAKILERLNPNDVRVRGDSPVSTLELTAAENGTET
jgi:hypothetical protein